MKSVSNLLDRVEGGSQTLTVYNHTGPDDRVVAFEEHFGRRNTAVTTETTPSGTPVDFAVLREGERFLAAGRTEPAYRAIRFDEAAIDDVAFGSEEYQYPSILEHASTTAFTSYDKRRMILASREIESAAWRVGAGELHTGFQRLSVMADQRAVYAKLVDAGLDVHVYGVPDRRPELADRLCVHAGTDEEIRKSWFVVFDGNGIDTRKAALVSEERDPGRFYGFWTYEPAVVDEVMAYFRNDRVPVGAPGTDTAAD